MRMSRWRQFWLCFHTVRYLKPTQILYQVFKRLPCADWKRRRLRTKTWHAKKMMPATLLVPALDLDPACLSRWRLEDLLEGQIEILHEKHRIDLARWHVAGASHLWNYNLHYLEFLVPLAAACKDDRSGQCWEKWCEYVDAWIACPADDSFAPYTISMRIPNLLICMNLLQEKLGGSGLKQRLTDSLYWQYRYLMAAQEYALLSNHYFENLKAIVIGSVLFCEDDVYEKYFGLFLGQIREQVLPDGVHYERSLTYQKIIIEGILRVYAVICDSPHSADAGKLIPTLRLMAGAAGSLEAGFGHTPLFNDAGDNVGKPCAALLAACIKMCGDIDTGKRCFPDAGYYRLDYGKCRVIFDCGGIGPKYMGGHAHNDCLSFELNVDGKSIFTNSGTGQYQGDLREFFRSTAAHNTMMIDDREQSELWGEHRAARRIGRIKAEYREDSVAGQFRSYRGDSFQRKMHWQDGSLMITDEIRSPGRGRHIARQFFHLAPGCHFERTDGGVKIISGGKTAAVMELPENAGIRIHGEGQITVYAPEFGKYEKKQVLEICTAFHDKARIKIAILVK